MADIEFLKALTEVPSVGTACKPAMNLLTKRFGAGYQKTFVPDGFLSVSEGGRRSVGFAGCLYRAR